MPDADAIALHQKLDSLQGDVQEVKALAQQTNSRVSKLELWRARREGAMAAVSWLGPVVTGIVTALVVAYLTH